MKIRRFVKKRRRRVQRRIENVASAKHLGREDRAELRRFADMVRTVLHAEATISVDNYLEVLQ